MSADELVAEVIASHFPNPPARREDIIEFERQSGFQLPNDMRQFWLACNGAALFKPESDCPPFRLVRIAEFQRARVAVFGSDEAKYGPESQYVFCDRRDGDYVGIDLHEAEVGDCPILDIWHESYPDCEPIEASFTTFLERALRSGGDSLFWMSGDAEADGDY